MPGRPLGVGVQLPEVERDVRWPEYRAMARAAEAVGFDSIWVGDHLLYRYPDGSTRGPWEAWTTLAGLAEATERITLGPLVAATAFHAPAMLAKLAGTVDEISGGRLVLGLGAGWNDTEFQAYGFPYDQRVSRFEEAFTIIRTLLAEGRIDFDGRFFQARDCELLPPPTRKGGPPILIGSNGDRMLRIALPYASAWNSWFTGTGNVPDGVAPLNASVDAAARDVGRDPADIERTVCILIRFPDGAGRPTAKTDLEPQPAPLEGPPEVIADVCGGGHRPCAARPRPHHRGVDRGARACAGASRPRLSPVSPTTRPDGG
jgi:alkanesulfonate monooxygenase SsuD/methylene tetrahydromethanopterin reductase-like flavin-dependent oxidoreductase (luciferase family)